MITLSNQSRMRGFFTLEKFSAKKTANGTQQEVPGSRTTVAQFENLITDAGLNSLGIYGIASATNCCYVGSGSTPPTVRDNAMDAFIAAIIVSGVSTGAQTATEPYYLYSQKTFRFDQGAAAGNLAEVGIGLSENPKDVLFSRTLIRDASGNPTTITVFEQEYLDVSYEIRIYPELTDSIGVVSIGDVDYDYTARASRVNSTSAGGWNLSNRSNLGAYPAAYSGGIGDVLESPDGQAGTGFAQPVEYDNNSLQASAQFTWGLNEANFDGVRSIVASVGWTRWQLEFAAQGSGDPIPKNKTNILSVTLTHSWARG